MNISEYSTLTSMTSTTALIITQKGIQNDKPDVIMIGKYKFREQDTLDDRLGFVIDTKQFYCSSYCLYLIALNLV